MPARKVYELKSEIQRARAKHPPFDLVLPDVKLPAGVPIEEGQSPNEFDRKTVQIPSAVMMSDDVVTVAQTDPVSAARMLLGEQDYLHMIAAGGSSTILFRIIAETNGADLGESEPSSDS